MPLVPREPDLIALEPPSTSRLLHKPSSISNQLRCQVDKTHSLHSEQIGRRRGTRYIEGFRRQSYGCSRSLLGSFFLCRHHDIPRLSIVLLLQRCDGLLYYPHMDLIISRPELLYYGILIRLLFTTQHDSFNLCKTRLSFHLYAIRPNQNIRHYRGIIFGFRTGSNRYQQLTIPGCYVLPATIQLNPAKGRKPLTEALKARFCLQQGEAISAFHHAKLHYAFLQPQGLANILPEPHHSYLCFAALSSSTNTIRPA